MSILITGATGHVGSYLLPRIADAGLVDEVTCLVRSTSHRRPPTPSGLSVRLTPGDTTTVDGWLPALSECAWRTIVHMVHLTHVVPLLDALHESNQRPHLVVIGTTGVHSRYRQAAARYLRAQEVLFQYEGPWCLLRPTLIYGSPRDRNMTRLIRFCSRWGFFWMFGSGRSLLQPVHADDVAGAVAAAVERRAEGVYDLSGDRPITYRDLLSLTSELLGKPVRQVRLPVWLGVPVAAALERALGTWSPVKREQILRLQEDKAFDHEAATRSLGFAPRSLEAGLQEQIELMRRDHLI
jgi:nucleoside-diphosphate-sugar epimerase